MTENIFEFDVKLKPDYNFSAKSLYKRPVEQGIWINRRTGKIYHDAPHIPDKEEIGDVGYRQTIEPYYATWRKAPSEMYEDWHDTSPVCDRNTDAIEEWYLDIERAGHAYYFVTLQVTISTIDGQSWTYECPGYRTDHMKQIKNDTATAIYELFLVHVNDEWDKAKTMQYLFDLVTKAALFTGMEDFKGISTEMGLDIDGVVESAVPAFAR